MAEQSHFPNELRDAASQLHGFPYTKNCLERAAVEIERLNALMLDACKVLDHYDLPEHALHYRRDILGLEQAKKVARGEANG